MHQSEVNQQGLVKFLLCCLCIGALYTLAIALIDRSETKRQNAAIIERIGHDR